MAVSNGWPTNESRISSSASPGLVCLLTVHGIGFQQQPRPPDLRGYADCLHQNLHAELGSPLGDDPNRTRDHDGDAGPVYVASEWEGNIEKGLDRVAQTTPDGGLDWSQRPLAGPGAKIAHVALVYAGLESTRPHLGVGLRALCSTLIHLNRYASPITVVRMGWRDFRAFQPVAATAGDAEPCAGGIQVRSDVPHRRLLPHPRKNRVSPPGSTSGDVVAQLEDDVASYVYNRRLHDRVHDFVSDVVERLLARDDVATVVFNAHSQGSVVCYQVLQELSTDGLSKVGAFISAGSPLRKYVDFFGLNNGLAGAGKVPWVNFWDAVDPVGDPLTPPREWRPLTDASVAVGQVGLFRRGPAGGMVTPARLTDHEVDNIHGSVGPGMRAHNYWGNPAQFIEPVAGILRTLAAGTPLNLNPDKPR